MEGVPAEVLRVGAVARLDPDPERELAAWRGDLDRGAYDDPAETRRRLDAHDRGEAAIVELGLFADVLDGDELRRIDGIHVPGLWFARGETEANVLHATDVVGDRLDELRDDLQRHGVPASTVALSTLPVRIEVDDALDRALTPPSDY